MNPIDLFLIFLLIFSGLNGLRLGLIRALANLVGWVFAFVLAVQYSKQVQPFTTSFSHDLWVQKSLAFALVVICVLMLTWFVTYIIESIVNKLHFSWLNRLSGGAFGLAKSIFLCLIAIQVAYPLCHRMAIWQNSVGIAYLLPYVHDARSYSAQVMQKTSKEDGDTQTNANSGEQDGIIRPPTRGEKSQVKNPFN